MNFYVKSSKTKKRNGLKDKFSKLRLPLNIKKTGSSKGLQKRIITLNVVLSEPRK